jgi:hypothetical protein
MHFRPGGATHKEVVDAVGSHQAVRRIELVEQGNLAEARAKWDGAVAYTLSLPPKAGTRATTKATGKRNASRRGKRSR